MAHEIICPNCWRVNVTLCHCSDGRESRNDPTADCPHIKLDMGLDCPWCLQEAQNRINQIQNQALDRRERHETHEGPR